LLSVRGNVLAKLGRFDEGRTEFRREAELTHIGRQRLFARSPDARDGFD